MMADTILLALLIVGFFTFLLYALLKRKKISRKKLFLSLGFLLIAIISVFFYTGFEKIRSDISRIVHNSRPKSSTEIYTLLFKKPLDNCITMANFKDQLIPGVDCCIWMEVKLCPAEFNRLLHLKKYEKTVFLKSDSALFLQTFGDRPKWWSPQNLSNSITKLHFIFNQENQQSIFFGADSSVVFICDKAL